MYINPQDMLYVVGTICLLWITGFLCWALYETARLMRKTNEVVTETQDKLHEVEEFVDDVVEKVSSLSSYLGVISNVGSKVAGLLGHRGDEEEEMIRPQRKIRRYKKQILDEEV